MAIAQAAHDQAADAMRDMARCARHFDAHGFDRARGAFVRAKRRADAWANAADAHAAKSSLDAAQASISTSAEGSHAQH